ncbi:MAG: PqqD family peptide modification chaperone [Chloroflexi bacterium]|nr:PqqD family peptide modification chaperone [Chloroflexota bacterium]
MKTTDSFRINTLKVVHEVIDGETIILNLDSGNYYSLVETGAKIWDLLATMNSVDNIVKELCFYYEGSGNEIDNEVNSFISALITEGLLVSRKQTGTELLHDAGSVNQPDKITAKIEFKPPALNKYSDMQDLLLLDPIHEVDVIGWPTIKPIS